MDFSLRAKYGLGDGYICLQITQAHGWRVSTKAVDSGACVFAEFHPVQGDVLKQG